VLEITDHGFNHENFPTFNYSAQYSFLKQSNDNFRKWFNGWTPTGFIAPYNKFNADTVRALIENNYTHVSSEVDVDKPPYTFTNDTFYRVPIQSSTNDMKDQVNFIGIPHNNTWSRILTQLSTYGFAGVMMHPMECAEISIQNKTVKINDKVNNQTMVNELRMLLQLAKDSNIRVVPMSKVSYWYRLNGTDPFVPTTVPTTNALTDHTDIPVDTNTNIGIDTNPSQSASETISESKPTTPETTKAPVQTAPIEHEIVSLGSQTGSNMFWVSIVLASVLIGLALYKN